MNVQFPYQIDDRGRTADRAYEDHIRDLIEQVLLTTPGERVNRPDFGTGLLQLTFAPNSPELAASLRATAQASLQRWLSDLIDVQKLEVSCVDYTLNVFVSYVIKNTQSPQTAQFAVGGTS